MKPRHFFKRLFVSITLGVSMLSLQAFAESDTEIELVPAQTDVKLEQFNLGFRSVQGREMVVYRLGKGQDEFVFFFGGFHGDEAQGVYMLEAFKNELLQNPDLFAGKSVFILPQVNPDGVAAKRRVNHHGVDLNRNFPTQNYRADANPNSRYYAGKKALSEPESQLVYQLLEPFVERLPAEKIKIMSIHAPLAVNNYDGPAEALATAMKQYNQYPISSDIGYPTPGSFGSYYGKEKGIRVVTLETGRVTDELAWKRQRKALYAFLLYPQAVMLP